MTGQSGGGRWTDGTGIALGLVLGAGVGTPLFDSVPTGAALGLALGVGVDAVVRRRREQRPPATDEAAPTADDAPPAG